MTSNNWTAVGYRRADLIVSLCQSNCVTGWKYRIRLLNSSGRGGPLDVILCGDSMNGPAAAPQQLAWRDAPVPSWLCCCRPSPLPSSSYRRPISPAVIICGRGETREVVEDTTWFTGGNSHNTVIVGYNSLCVFEIAVTVGYRTRDGDTNLCSWRVSLKIIK